VREDPGDTGAARGFSRGRFSGRRVHVPFSPNARTVTGAAGLRSYAGSVAWYRTGVAVRGGRYALRFESVNHRATVWVDGRLVARHVGDDLPFDVALTLARGRHRVVVRADWRDPDAMKAQGWHRSWFNFGGLDREVTLRPLGAVALEAPAVVTRLARGGGAVVEVRARVRAAAGAGRRVRVRVTGTLGGRALAFGAVAVPRGGVATARATLRLAHAELWAPGRPRLQVLHLAAPGAGWTARVGLRELRWDGGRLRVNGRPLTLHGASLQEDALGRGSALREADLDAIVGRLRAIGANATRAQHPLSPPLLERLDAAGILLWQEVGPMDGPGNWTSTTPALQRRALRRDVITVEQERTHPSVLTWNLGNEVAHQGHPGGQAAYVRAAARLLHRLDPGRPVALDVWGRGLPADAAGVLYRDVDVFGVTMYEGWYERPGEAPAAVAANLRRRLAVAHAIFPGRVLVLTEFGAEANTSNAPDAPGGEAYQARLIGQQIRILRADRRLGGWLVWALSDFALTPTFGGGSVRQALPGLRLVPGINAKGLFGYDGRAKPAAAVVRALSGAPSRP
jgi:beta-galactosidase/beta-glucuronidase